MSRKVDQYISLSMPADPAKTQTQFDSLVSECRAYLADRRIDYPALKDALAAMGFGYGYSVFRVHEVLEKRKSNCLGTPLLLGCLGQEFGLQCGFRIVVSPQDAIYNDELTFLEDLHQNTRYDRPILSTRPETMRWMRFVPLEHMVLEIDGQPFDTTPGESGELPSFEAGRSLAFEQALTYVLQDRAALAYNRDDFEEASRLVGTVLELCPDNREVHGFAARLAMDYFDDQAHSQHLEEYNRLGADDSLAQFNLFAMTRKESFLPHALKQYPAYAEALACQAKILVLSDPGEGRVQYAISSRMFAESVALELPRFFWEHFRQLGTLFGPEVIAPVLANLADQENTWGMFDYHCALYALTGSTDHRAESVEIMTTPLHELKLMRADAELAKEISSKLKTMDNAYKGSYLYAQARQELFGGD